MRLGSFIAVAILACGITFLAGIDEWSGVIGLSLAVLLILAEEICTAAKEKP